MKIARPLTAALFVCAPAAAFAGTVEFDFAGLGGPGLTSANEVGANTPVTLPDVATTAFGGETGDGLVLDTESNTLNFAFSFSELSGGLFDAASGIHLHESAEGADPFSSTGPIVFNLNSFDDDAVTNTNTPIFAGSGDGDGAVSGVVSGSLVLTDLQEQSLLDGRFYLNIHTDTFRGGELRGNLVASSATAVPTPAAAGLGLSLLGLLGSRRRGRQA